MLLQELANDSILSENYSDFVTESYANIPKWIDTNVKEVPNIFKDYDYPVSPWPVLIGKETALILEELCIKIPKLLNQVPFLYFNDDVKKIADYYFEGNEMLAQFALMAHSKNIDVSCRLDLTLTTDGFKILEANIGSSIGGWQVQSFESIIRKIHPKLSNTLTATNFDSKNIQQLYVVFLVDEILKYVTISDEINVFIELSHVPDKILKEYSVEFFNEMLNTELAKRKLKGKVVSGELSELKLIHGNLHFKNDVIHSLLLLSLNTEEISPDIFRAFMMDSIHFPDHLGVSIIRDKRNLGLLRTLAEQQKFEEKDNELILSCIPWTSMITDETQEVIFKKEKYILSELLRTYKDQFVIKASNGFQGIDVFIGKFLSQEAWEKAILLALKTKAFIAQEFSESKNFLAPNIEKQWTPHKLIWGAFGFGETYGGVWVRMSEVATDIGVINSATGAIEAIVYEVL